MEMPYVGPYRVVWGPDSRDRYGLRDVHGRRFPEFHVSKLKFFPADEEIGDEYYVVESIEGSRRTSSGAKEYLVKWQGYSSKHNSWEPYANLNQAARLTALEFDKAERDKLGAAVRADLDSAADEMAAAPASEASGAGADDAAEAALPANDKQQTPTRVQAQPVHHQGTGVDTAEQMDERAARAAARARRKAELGH